MQLGATEEFTSEEQAILADLAKGEQQATDPTADQTAQGQASEQQAQTTGTEGATGTDTAAQPGQAATQEADKPQGDVRAALRASRRSEARARDEAARFKAENEALRARLPADQQQQDTGEMTDDEIATAERDFPLLGKTARFVKAQMTANAAANPQQAQHQAEFIPPALPANVQELVDGNADLLAWQHNPDQGRFTLAKSVDALLTSHPKWASASMEARFQEVVRRVNEELGPAAAPTRRDPQQVLANVPRQKPETLSHIGGGGGKQPEAPALQRYMAMSDEAIVADLLREG